MANKFQMNLSDELRRFRQLHLAVREGQKEIIESLLEAGAPVNRYPVWYELETPLHSAVHLGDLDIVARLLSKGACVNAKYSDETPIILAAKLEKLEIVDILLATKGLKNCTGRDGMTHFHVACMRNQVGIAKTLLLYETDVNIAVSCNSDYWPGFTALHFAVRFQNIEAVEFLLKAGADITIKDARKCTPLHLAHKLRKLQIVDIILMHHIGIASNPIDFNGLSHFHIACTRNKSNVVEHFIEIGVDLRDPVSKKVDGPVKMAIDLAIQHECVDVLRLLLQYWNPNTSKNGEEYLRIINAHRSVNLDIVNLLISKNNLRKRSRKSKLNILGLFSLQSPRTIKTWFFGTQSDVLIGTESPLNVPITPTGCTPLHSAIECRSHKVITFLMDQGADHTIQDIRGKSPLHLAFEHNMTELVDLMLTDQRLPPQNIVDNNGLSHLHIACASNNVNVVESLLKLGENVNGSVNLDAIFWSGFSPLHFAAKFGNVKVAQILLKYGANYSALSASNLSPFDVAFMEAQSNSYHAKSALDLVKLILTFHSQSKDELFNNRGVTLLHLACSSIDYSPYSTVEELRKLLNTHAGDVNKVIHKIGTSWDGYTPLHLAVQNRDTTDHAKLLIRMGADILSQNLHGDTPMHVLSWMTDLSDSTIDFQDSRFLQLNHIGTTTGLSIFHVACAQSNLDLMRYYLEHEVDPNCSSLAFGLGCEDLAPLHLVIRESHKSCVEAVKLLLEYGADPNMTDMQKQTPLHEMHSCFRYPEIIEILVSHGADIDALNAQLETPLVSLLCALENDNNLCGEFIRHIELFLDNGANIDSSDERGETVLAVANSWIRVQPDDFFGGFNHSLSKAVKIIEILLKHIIKLDCIGFKITNKTNKELYTSFLRSFSHELSFEENALIQTCNHELELMKVIRTNSHTSLYDILRGSPNKLAVISQNTAFQNIVNSNDIREKYPVYGSMLKLRLIQGQVRWRLLNELQEPLNSLSGITLPRVCSESIFQYLNNGDLRNLITLEKHSKQSFHDICSLH